MAKRKKAKRIRSPADSASGRTNVLLEEQQSKFNLLADGLKVVDDKCDRLDRRLEKVEAAVTVLPALVATVRMHSDELREIKAIARGIQTTVEEMNGKLDKKADQAQVDALAEKVSALDAG